MPQMSPFNWLTMYMIFTFTMMFSMSKIFFFSEKKINIMNLFNKNLKYFKWSW